MERTNNVSPPGLAWQPSLYSHQPTPSVPPVPPVLLCTCLKRQLKYGRAAGTEHEGLAKHLARRQGVQEEGKPSRAGEGQGVQGSAQEVEKTV